MLVAQDPLAVIKPKEEGLWSVGLCLQFCVSLESLKATAGRKQIKGSISTVSGGQGRHITESIAAEKGRTDSALGKNRSPTLKEFSFSAGLHVLQHLYLGVIIKLFVLSDPRAPQWYLPAQRLVPENLFLSCSCSSGVVPDLF